MERMLKVAERAGRSCLMLDVYPGTVPLEAVEDALAARDTRFAGRQPPVRYRTQVMEASIWLIWATLAV